MFLVAHIFNNIFLWKIIFLWLYDYRMLQLFWKGHSESFLPSLRKIFLNSLDFLKQNHKEKAEKFVAKGKSNIKFWFQQWVGVLDSFTFWQDISSKPAENTFFFFFWHERGNQKSVAENIRHKKKGRREYWG